MTDSAEQTQQQQDDYIKTTTHNFISRKAAIEGAQRVQVQGRSILLDGVKIRGDLGVIVRIGRYVRIENDTTLEPAPMLNSGDEQQQRVPMIIGNHTRIMKNCYIQAAAIGSMVLVGEGARIGQRCLIKDCCIIDENVVLGDDTVIPPFTRVSMDTARGDNKYQKLRMQELPPSMTVELQESAMDQYDAFANERRAR